MACFAVAARPSGSVVGVAAVTAFGRAISVVPAIVAAVVGVVVDFAESTWAAVAYEVAASEVLTCCFVDLRFGQEG